MSHPNVVLGGKVLIASYKGSSVGIGGCSMPSGKTGTGTSSPAAHSPPHASACASTSSWGVLGVSVTVSSAVSPPVPNSKSSSPNIRIVVGTQPSGVRDHRWIALPPFAAPSQSHCTQPREAAFASMSWCALAYPCAVLRSSRTPS